MTETFVDNSFNYDSIFTDHRKFVAPAKKLSHRGRNSGGVILLVRNKFSRFVKETKFDCDNTAAVRIDKAMFNTKKDVVLNSCVLHCTREWSAV